MYESSSNYVKLCDALFFQHFFVDVSDVINSMQEKYLRIITRICEIMFTRKSQKKKSVFTLFQLDSLTFTIV